MHVTLLMDAHLAGLANRHLFLPTKNKYSKIILLVNPLTRCPHIQPLKKLKYMCCHQSSYI